jgi:hypothetical protein
MTGEEGGHNDTILTSEFVYCTFLLKHTEAVDMTGIFQMQGGKNRILPKKINANRFFWDSHWLDIWSNHFCPSIGPNGGSVATYSGDRKYIISY